MGLKCSVLGHQFEEPGLVHEREQRGDEIIIVKRKVRICAHCGKQRVLAESKEITKRTDDDRDDTTVDRNDSISAATNDDSVSTTTDSIAIDETNEPGNESSDSQVTSESEPRSTGFAGVDVVHDATESTDKNETTMIDIQQTDDDGVILTDDDSDAEREYGEWPTESNETGTDGSWDSDVVDTPHRSSDTENKSVDTTISPKQDDVEIIETTDTMIDEPANDAMDETTNRTPNGEKTIECEICDFSVIASDSPFRSGDICPGCHESYLTDGV